MRKNDGVAKRKSPEFFCILIGFSYFVLHLPYIALYFTLNVRILGEVQPAELIDRGEKSDFFQIAKKNLKK